MKQSHHSFYLLVFRSIPCHRSKRHYRSSFSRKTGIVFDSESRDRLIDGVYVIGLGRDLIGSMELVLICAKIKAAA